MINLVFTKEQLEIIKAALESEIMCIVEVDGGILEEDSISEIEGLEDILDSIRNQIVSPV